MIRFALGGATIEMPKNDQTYQLKTIPKQYRRQISHDGQYAVGTLMMDDDLPSAVPSDDEESEVTGTQRTIQPRKCYIFVSEGDRGRLFEELDCKTAVPLIPEFRDCVLDALIDRGELRPNGENIIEILERALKQGAITIPGANPDQPDGFEDVQNIIDYLNTVGIIVADRRSHCCGMRLRKE